MGFTQTPPPLRSTWLADVPLREHLERVLPPAVHADVAPQLATLGDAAAGPLRALGDQAQAEPPRLVSYDAWGRRVDRIVCSPAWAALGAESVRLGLAALPYDAPHGAASRVVQAALAHLYGPSSATYTCPVSMTDAAARVLLEHGDPEVVERIVPRLTSRDPATAWTSGQWMTERPGGSDVGRTETVARRDADGGWYLTGVKWFTSATTADCALALARTVDADGHGVEGSRGLSLYLVELVDPRDGRRQIGDTILVNRLKDKLGTRSLPTAELTLQGAYATAVGPVGAGVKTISGMLAITRLWNAVQSAAGMARAVQLAVAYAGVREAFGRPLLEQPLHVETLGDLAVEAEAALALVLRVAELLGRAEQGDASDADGRALRGLLPVAKLLTAKDAIAVASEAIEAFGGAGYVEDTGLPALLRDAQVLAIWEGTTNVLALDLLRAARRDAAVDGVLAEVGRALEGADVPVLADAVRAVAAERDALAVEAAAWTALDRDAVEVGMRRFALRLGRCTSAALLCAHAGHRLAKHVDARAAAAARRYAQRWLGGGPGAAATPAARAERLADARTLALAYGGVQPTGA